MLKLCRELSKNNLEFSLVLPILQQLIHSSGTTPALRPWSGLYWAVITKQVKTKTDQASHNQEKLTRMQFVSELNRKRIPLEQILF